MAASPFMPLYIADYMADTAHLSTVEHGAYLLLIMNYWQRGGPLPDDDKKLARIAGLQGRNWKRVRAEIEPFFVFRDGFWHHQRIDKQLAVMRSQSKRNSLNGKKGGLATAGKLPESRCSEAVAKPKRKRSHTEAEADTDTLSKDKDAGASSDKMFWDSAKSYLGKSKSGMIGKWVRDHGKEETAKAITAAQIERAVDPVPYIERVLRGSGSNGHSGIPI